MVDLVHTSENSGFVGFVLGNTPQREKSPESANQAGRITKRLRMYELIESTKLQIKIRKIRNLEKFVI